MPRLNSPATPASSRTRGTDRDLIVGLLALAALGAVLALASLLVTAAAATSMIRTGQWHWPPLAHWPHVLWSILRHPAAPGAGFTGPLGENSATDPLAYWAAAITLIAGSTGGVLTVATALRHRLGSTGPGHATRTEIRSALSLRHARLTARWTRPDLAERPRRSLRPDEVGVPCHSSPDRTPMLAPLETPTGLIAPTRSGKSRRDVSHKILAAPGALFCSSTKTDLAEWCLRARSRKPDGGPVRALDLTGTLSWPATIRWDPVRDCTTPVTALRRAETLIAASAIGLSDVGGNDAVFRGRATIVLQAYLLAAATHGRDITSLLAWSIDKSADREPIELLRQRHPEQAVNLAAEIRMVAETSDAVWMSVRRAIEPFMNADIRQLCTPPAHEHFDPETFLTNNETLFVVAGQHQAPHARPVLTILAEEILTRAQDLALRQPNRRLVPPATAILDELYEATPVPRLPGLIADSAGRGVLIHWSAQSRSQLDDLFGEDGRRQLVDNTLTLTVLGGLKDDATLEWLATLCGQHRRATLQHHTDGPLSPGRANRGLETVPTYRAGDIRTLPRTRALVLHANLPPILAHTTDIEERPDWPTLAADTANLRSREHDVDHGVDHTGRPRPTPGSIPAATTGSTARITGTNSTSAGAFHRGPVDSSAGRSDGR